LKYILLIIYSLFYAKIPKYILQKWIASQKISWLIVVAKKGHYKNRIQIAEEVTSLHSNGQHKLIKVLVDDPIEYISQKTIEISKSLRLLDDLKTYLSKKENYWQLLQKEREVNAKATKEIYKNLPNYKRKFSNGESYQQMKQAAKKAMNIGKWI